VPQAIVQTVVKIGGGLLAHPARLDEALAAVAAAAGNRRLVVIPGGGPFADAVRAVDDRLGLSDDAAHWMAILAMDQFAHVLASRLPGGTIVDDRTAVIAALAASDGAGRRIPVLAPYRWLRQADPLRHTWDVTSDSIAAWIAGQFGAERLVLIKPPAASGSTLVDVQFTRVLPAFVNAEIVPVDQVEALRTALGGAG
jgi:aspartokinase-like uncharacterized kinase